MSTKDLIADINAATTAITTQAIGQYGAGAFEAAMALLDSVSAQPLTSVCTDAEWAELDALVAELKKAQSNC